MSHKKTGTFGLLVLPNTNKRCARIDRAQFLEKAYLTSKSDGARESVNAHLTNLDLYCKDKYSRDTETILDSNQR